MEEPVIDVILFIAGVTVTVCLAISGIWFKMHRRQDNKIETMQQTNGKEHADLYKKIDRLDEKGEERGRDIRQAIDQVMHHLLEVKR